MANKKSSYATIGKSSFVESWFSIHEETQEIEILGGVKQSPNAELLMVQCHPIIKSLILFIAKTTLRNIMQTLQKHYASL